MNINEILRTVLDKIDESFSKNVSYLGHATGFDDVDCKSLGLKPSELTVIAARPSMGKTTFCTNILKNIAVDAEMNVAYFSANCSAEEVVMRMIVSMKKIPLWKLRTGKIEDGDWCKLTAVVNTLKDKYISIFDSPSMSIMGICQQCIDSNHNKKLDLIIVDDIQQLAIRSEENTDDAISEIAHNLKLLAVTLKIPIIVTSQLNRDLEQRKNKRPILSDLKETGILTQLADMIIFIYRDEIYEENSDKKGIAEIIIKKNRFGPTGFVHLAFNSEHMVFETIIESFD